MNDAIQKYAEAKRAGRHEDYEVQYAMNPPRKADLFPLWMVVAQLLLLAILALGVGYTVHLLSAKDPKAAFFENKAALTQLIAGESSTFMQQYVIDKFFATVPKPGQKLTLLVCKPNKGCERFASPVTLYPAQ